MLPRGATLRSRATLAIALVKAMRHLAVKVNILSRTAPMSRSRDDNSPPNQRYQGCNGVKA